MKKLIGIILLHHNGSALTNAYGAALVFENEAHVIESGFIKGIDYKSVQQLYPADKKRKKKETK